MTQGAAYFGDKNESGFLALVVVSATCIVGLLLLIGFLTRMAKVNAAPLVTPTTALLFALIAIALICLGPGAYSLDARLFGRREIIIPARSAKE